MSSVPSYVQLHDDLDRTRSTLDDVMADHVEQDRVGGVAWLAARGDDVEVGVAGA